MHVLRHLPLWGLSVQHHAHGVLAWEGGILVLHVLRCRPVCGTLVQHHACCTCMGLRVWAQQQDSFRLLLPLTLLGHQGGRLWGLPARQLHPRGLPVTFRGLRVWGRSQPYNTMLPTLTPLGHQGHRSPCMGVCRGCRVSRG